MNREGDSIPGRQASPGHLKAVAVYHKATLTGILLLLIAHIVAGAVTVELPAWFGGVVFLAIALLVACCLFLLASEVYTPWVGVLAGVAIFVPVVGLVSALLVEMKARRILQSHGIEVGLLGADLTHEAFASAETQPGFTSWMASMGQLLAKGPDALVELFLTAATLLVACLYLLGLYEVLCRFKWV